MKVLQDNTEREREAQDSTFISTGYTHIYKHFIYIYSTGTLHILPIFYFYLYKEVNIYTYSILSLHIVLTLYIYLYKGYPIYTLQRKGREARDPVHISTGHTCFYLYLPERHQYPIYTYLNFIYICKYTHVFYIYTYTNVLYIPINLYTDSCTLFLHPLYIPTCAVKCTRKPRMVNLEPDLRHGKTRP